MTSSHDPATCPTCRRADWARTAAVAVMITLSALVLLAVLMGYRPPSPWGERVATLLSLAFLAWCAVVEGWDRRHGRRARRHG